MRWGEARTPVHMPEGHVMMDCLVSESAPGLAVVFINRMGERYNVVHTRSGLGVVQDLPTAEVAQTVATFLALGAFWNRPALEMRKIDGGYVALRQEAIRRFGGRFSGLNARDDQIVDIPEPGTELDAFVFE